MSWEDHVPPEPTVLEILAGSHPYSVNPEAETAWCRLCLLWGILIGVLVSGLVFW